MIPRSTQGVPPLFEGWHSDIVDRVTGFVTGEVQPAEDEHGTLEARRRNGEEDLELPSTDERTRSFARQLADAGVLQYAVPERWGGGNIGEEDDLDLRALCLIREALAWGSGLCDTTFAMQGLGSYPIARFGTDAQREEWLPPVADGTCLAAFAITEESAGSDIGSMTTRATKDGDDWILDGEKTLISNAGVAGSYVVFANAEPGNKKAISAFLVRPDDTGFEVTARLTAMADHPLGTLRLDGCRLGADRLLGEIGLGMKIALTTLDVFRSSVGAAALGIAQRALDEALHRSLSRKQFGAPIFERQQTQAYLADSETELEAARLLVYRAAWLRDRRVGRITREAAMAKLAATESAQRIVDRAVQLHGGIGVLLGTTVERLYREVRALRIYEGTSEIQRLVIAGELRKHVA